jgi:cold shock CspA family protein
MMLDLIVKAAESSLQENQRVEFTATRGPKGPQAEQVQPL